MKSRGRSILIATASILIFFNVFFHIFPSTNPIEPFVVTGSSMEPLFVSGELLFSNKFSYKFSSPRRGDIIIFKHPDAECSAFIKNNYVERLFFQGPCRNYIKRIIGVPGDTVIVKDGQVTIKNKEFPEGKLLAEDYIQDNVKTMGNVTKTIGKNEFFVLGDNRLPNASSDSREWGLLPRTHIVGKGFVVLLPIDEFQIVQRANY